MTDQTSNYIDEEQAEFEAGVDAGFDDYAYEYNQGERAFEASHNMTDPFVELYAHERTCNCPQCNGDPDDAEYWMQVHGPGYDAGEIGSWQ